MSNGCFLTNARTGSSGIFTSVCSTKDDGFADHRFRFSANIGVGLRGILGNLSFRARFTISCTASCGASFSGDCTICVPA